MTQYNLSDNLSLGEKYHRGQLPQRNSISMFYQDSSCRSNLAAFSLSSENRRIIRKTDHFTYEFGPIHYDLPIQKRIFGWLKLLQWDFPISSVKTVFTRHIFNQLYTWKENEQIVAYSVCYFDEHLSHIAYVFYDPKYHHSDLPIRLVLQTVIDSQHLGLQYCYLGRFSSTIGYYKRNMPGFEYFHHNQWQKY
jgi:arginyl-tRNA--protein-N-Asp/Glu arginylyltransferase